MKKKEEKTRTRTEDRQRHHHTHQIPARAFRSWRGLRIAAVTQARRLGGGCVAATCANGCSWWLLGTTDGIMWDGGGARAAGICWQGFFFFFFGGRSGLARRVVWVGC